MPIYEYRCEHCGEEFEELVLGKFLEVSCPTCTNQDVTRLISSFSFKSEGGLSKSAGSSGCSTCSSSNCSSCH